MSRITKAEVYEAEPHSDGRSWAAWIEWTDGEVAGGYFHTKEQADAFVAEWEAIEPN